MARQRLGLGERARRSPVEFCLLLHQARVHQHAPPRAELKKMRPQAGGFFDKSGAFRPAGGASGSAGRPRHIPEGQKHSDF
jgi:hypothetical protein